MSGSRAGCRERFLLRRVAHLVGWNLLILLALLLLAAGSAEACLRMTIPFRENVRPIQMVPGVGVINLPHAEVRATNWRDFWQVSRTNSLGFLDREPPDEERAAESCHVTFIGDSFVQAAEVSLRDRAQVQLEALAAREAPDLDVTTSAFGYRGTAPISQLPYYDAYARKLSPDVVVLVSVLNDFGDTSLVLRARDQGFSPDYPPYLFARRGADGAMTFVPPASSLAELQANLLPRLPPTRASLGSRVEWKLREWSYLADRLWIRSGHLRRGCEGPCRSLEQRVTWAGMLREDPRYAGLMDDWALAGHRNDDLFLDERPPPAYREVLDVMRFALAQFRERAERDGAALVILASHRMGGAGDPHFQLLRELAGSIPVISQTDYVVATGGEVWELQFKHDPHWNPTGHRWAAEAIWAWMKANPHVCD